MPATAFAHASHDDTRTRRRALLDAARVYVCTTARTDQGDLEDFLDAVYSGGADIVQLRDKKLEARAEVEALGVLARVARRHGKLFAVNDRADIAALTGADVFHVGQGDLTTAQARQLLGPDVLLGRSTHSVEQAAAADADAALDYFCVGPVWPTPTKPGRAAIGLDTVRAVAASSPVSPWFAIGGIDAGDRLDAAIGAGATRIVVVRAVTDADDPRAAAHTLRARMLTR